MIETWEAPRFEKVLQVDRIQLTSATGVRAKSNAGLRQKD